MDTQDLTAKDAENIQSILEYVGFNEVMHREQLPETLSHITPEQYRNYKEIIFGITPAVVEDTTGTGNLGIPATENLKPYLEKGGFIAVFQKIAAARQKEEYEQLLSRQLQQDYIDSNRKLVANASDAMKLARKASLRATAALILALLAVLWLVLRSF